MESIHSGLIRPLKPSLDLRPKSETTLNKAKKASTIPKDEVAQKQPHPLLPKSQQALNKRRPVLAPKPTGITKINDDKKPATRVASNDSKATYVKKGTTKKTATHPKKQSKAPESEHLFILEVQGESRYRNLECLEFSANHKSCQIGTAELHVQHHKEVIAPQLDKAYNDLVNRLEQLRTRANGTIEASNKRIALLKKPLTNKVLDIRSKEGDAPTRIRFGDQIELFQTKMRGRAAHLRSLIEKRGRIEAVIETLSQAIHYRAQMDKLKQDYAKERAEIIRGAQTERDRLLAQAEKSEKVRRSLVQLLHQTNMLFSTTKRGMLRRSKKAASVCLWYWTSLLRTRRTSLVRSINCSRRSRWVA